MLVIGERINTVAKRVLRAYQEKDADYMRELAVRQVAAGADVVDINAGMAMDVEPAAMAWAVGIVQDAVDVPLCIDSPNPATIRSGFMACRDKTRAWANSVTLDPERLKGILPLVREHGGSLIALCMDQTQIPERAEERVEVAKRLVEAVEASGIPLSSLYLDPMIEPVSIHPDRGQVCLRTIRGIKAELPEIKTVICLSAVSHGLPERRLLNRAYMSLLMHEGIDAVIMDPLDADLMMHMRATNAVLGRDEHGMEYIAAYRECRAKGRYV